MSLEKLWKEAKHVLAFVLAIALFFNGWANYDFSVFAEGEQLTVTLSGSEAVYTGSEISLPTLGVQKDGNSVSLDAENVTVVWKDDQGQEINTVNNTVVEAGTYTVMVTVIEKEVDENEESVGEPTVFSGTAEFTVEKINLEDAEIEGVEQDYDYTGEEIKPAVSVKYHGKQISETLYDVSYENNTDAGNAVINITPKSEHSVGVINKKSVNFTINKINLSDQSKAAITDVAAEYEYTGSEIKPEVKVKYGDNVVNSKFYDVQYESNKESGNATVTVTAKSEYEKNVIGSCTKNYKIIKISLAANNEKITVNVAPAVANTEKQEPKVEVIYTTDAGEKITLIKNIDYIVEVKDNAVIQKKGDYPIIIKAVENGNYTGERTVDFKIEYATDGNIVISGNTLADNYYSGDVTIRAEKNTDCVSKDELNGYAPNFIYREGDSLLTTIYVKGTGVSKIDIEEETVKFDNKKPSKPTVTDANANKEWVTERTFTVTASDNVGLYNNTVYYTADKVKDGLNVITVDMVNNMTAVTNGTVTFASEEKNKVYYFYAIDKAGNYAVTEVEVKGIDTKVPVAELSEENNFYDSLYWKNSEELNIAFNATDESDISAITLKCGEEDLSKDVKLDATSTKNLKTGILTIKKAGTYTLTVIDATDINKSEITFEVKQDTGVPTLTLTAEGPNKYLGTENVDVYWFSEANVSVEVGVHENTGASEENAPFEVVFAVDDDSFTEKMTTVSGYADEESIIDVSHTLAPATNSKVYTTYYYKITDCAGNTSVGSINLGYDNTKPVIERAVLTQSGGDEWINASEIAEKEGFVEFSMKLSDAQTGIKQIGYRSADDQEFTLIDAKEVESKDGVYRFTTKDKIADGKAYKWSVVVINNVKLESEVYTFKGVDVEDNPIYLGQIDTLAPEDEVYIQFFTDTVGSNDLSVGNTDKNNGWTSKILEVAGNAWNRIWGKKTVSFEVYVMDASSKDVASGIAGPDAVKMTYGDNKKIALTNVTGVQAFDAERSKELQGNGYSIFTGSITIGENETLSVSDFKIASITDIAGNITENIALKGAQEGDIIYLDSVAPELISVKIDEAADNSIESNGDYKFFYNKAENVQIVIRERFFGMEVDKPVYPEVIVKNRDYTQSNNDFSENKVLNKSAWIDLQEDYKWSLSEKVNLPVASKEAEMEYRLEMFYKDPADNFLTIKENKPETTNDNETGKIIEEGRFLSDIYVVDTLAPKLTTFVIKDTASDISVFPDKDGIYYAKNNVDDADVTITVGINDHAEYFNAENVHLYYITDDADMNDEEKWTEITDLSKKWKNTKGREWTAEYTFDGIKDEEHTYRFKVVYSDMAQNSMINNGATADAANEAGAFISTQKVVIDHSAPKMTQLLFETPVQVFDEESNKENGTASTDVKNDSSRMYYSEDGIVRFDIEDTYLKASDIRVNVQKRADKEGTFANVDSYKGNDIEVDGAFKFKLPEEDAEYQYTISYTDRSGNEIIYAENVETNNNVAYEGAITGENFKSSVLIRDTVDPAYKVTYTDSNEKAVGEKTNNSVKSIEAVVNVTEMNLDMKETKIYVTATDVNGEPIKDCREVDIYNNKSWYNGNEKESVDTTPGATRENDKEDGKLNQHSLTMTFETEANYTIRINVVDKVTKKVAHTYSFCIDRTVPEIKIVDKNGEHPNDVVKGALVDMDKSDISYTVINDGTFSQILNKLTFGYFAKAKIRVQIKAHDQISGVKNIIYTYSDVNGNSKTEITTPKVNADDKSCSVITFELPISFKGQIQAFGIDNTGNSAVKTPSGQIGVIAETESKHMDTSKVNLEVLTNYSKTKDYYNGDVDVKFTSADEYSGLFLIKYTAGNDLVEDVVNYGKQGVEIVTSAIERNYTIKAATNNENNIVTGLMLEDNAGYTREIPEEELPKIHIDTTAPKVEVEYDNNDSLNEKYYKEDRIATVTVTERNFDPDDVHFDITGPNPSISSWSHTAGSGCTAGSNPEDTHHSDSCRWSCTVHFSEDGDYTFGFSCIDLAGNEGKYDQVDEFTIDKTLPEITVVYNNNDFQNEYYYKEARIATITINEHNFSSNDVLITMTASDDGRIIAVPGVSGWTSEGDIHKATIRYDYDAEFTFDIEFMDLAGNLAAEYDQDHFVVDQTAPELEIFDIEHMSANNGVVRPGIRYHDTNYDQNGTVILMTGYHNGVVEMTGDRKLEANGLELKLDDFAYVQEMDDIYTMEATVYDLAGNSSEAMVMFSVNRFGSVYTFDEATDALIGDNGKYYTNKEQQLVITETNVDTLEFKEITLNLNGKLTTLKEGVDYTVALDGNDATWKQYTYTLKADNFVEEGTYILTIYSEDRATNTSDNNTKGKKIEFVVDKTNPSALISGVENGGQYRMHSKEMTIDIEDNVRLSSVTVTIDGVETVYDAAQIQKMDGKLVLNIGSANHWQDVVVEVTDAAGNTEISEEMRVLVTANIFVQFFMNKPVFYGTLGGTALLAALLWWFLVGKKKKEEQAK